MPHRQTDQPLTAQLWWHYYTINNQMRRPDYRRFGIAADRVVTSYSKSLPVVKIQALVRGFMVRLKELQGMLVHGMTASNGKYIDVPRGRYLGESQGRDFGASPDEGRSADAYGHSGNPRIIMQFDGDSARWRHARNAAAAEPRSIIRAALYRIFNKWTQRKTILQGWYYDRKRVGVKRIDFDREMASLPDRKRAPSSRSKRHLQ